MNLKASLNASEKIQKNVLSSQYQLKKNLIMVKYKYKKKKFIDSFRFMSSSLSNLVDNLSGIFKKECKACMERKNIKSKCDFIGLKNIRFNYRCINVGKIALSQKMNQLKTFQLCISFARVTLINFFVTKKRCLSLWIHG